MSTIPVSREDKYVTFHYCKDDYGLDICCNNTYSLSHLNLIRGGDVM